MIHVGFGLGVSETEMALLRRTLAFLGGAFGRSQGAVVSGDDCMSKTQFHLYPFEILGIDKQAGELD